LSVLFLAVLLPTILRQVNKITRTMAGAEGRLAAINVDTDRIEGKLSSPLGFKTDNLRISPALEYQNDGELKKFVDQTIVDKISWDYLALDGTNLEPDEVQTAVLKLDQVMGLRSIFGQSKKMVTNIPAKSEAFVAAMASELINTGMDGKVTADQQNGDTVKKIQDLVKRLGDQQLALTGEGTWVFAVAARSANTYRVILVNYDPKGLHSEVVPVNFINLEQDSFEFRKTWLGFNNTTKEEISTSSGIIQRRISMLPNTVAFLELEAK